MKKTILLIVLFLVVHMGQAQFASEKPTFVLVHGAWHGGWSWKFVKEKLERHGYTVYTPSLSGLAEHKHLLNDNITLQTHILDIINLIEMEDLHNVVLVGHSYAGAVITGVADSISERLSKLIYLDAVLVYNGESPMTAEPEWEQARKRPVVERREHFQPVAPRFFGVTDSTLVDWVTEHLTPQPYMTFAQPLHLKNPLGNGLPKVYIACINPQLEVLKARSDLLKNDPSWTYLTLNTGHDAMITAPDELTALLIRLTQ